MFLGQEMERLLNPLRICKTSMISRFIIGFAWCILHLLVSIIHFGSHLSQVLKSYVVSTGILKRYQLLHLDNLRYLGVVVDSEEARNATQIKRFLRCLSNIGVKYIILYDMEGLLKKSLGTNQINLSTSSSNSNSCTGGTLKHEISRIQYEKMTVELLSFSDSKGAAAKAANFLRYNYIKDGRGSTNKIEPTFAESDLAAALKAVGYDAPDPDLLLVYGPARCHLGFPAWRMRYTEIVHMGPLSSMKYGAIIKAIYDFSKKQQNYGT